MSALGVALELVEHAISAGRALDAGASPDDVARNHQIAVSDSIKRWEMAHNMTEPTIPVIADPPSADDGPRE